MEKVKIYRIIKTENTENENALIKNAEKYVHPFMRDTAFICRDGYVILDFGMELCGRLHIVFSGNESGKFRIRLGESVAETCAEIGEKNAGNYHSLRDSVYPTVGLADVSSSETGFRFARIDVVEGNGIRISEIYAEEVPNGLKEKGSFSCSDDRINDIYKTAKRTLALCVREDSIWDGIKRDRAFWMGDFYPELVGTFFVYGKIEQFKKVLSTIKDYDGCWFNFIPSYSAWWIVCLEKYYEFTSDSEYVSEMLPYVDTVLNAFSQIVKADGSVSCENCTLKMFESNEFFFDWPTNLTPDSEIGWRYLLTYTVQKAERIYALFGKNCDIAKELQSRLDKYEYNPSEFKQVTAFGVLAGKIDKTEAASLLKHNGAEKMTCFMSFAIIEALREIGEGEYALELIKDYYGKMLDLGATTFWEDFDVDWLKDNPSPVDALPEDGKKNIHADYGKFCYTGLRHSLCHGWSSGFIDIFYTYVLGVIPTKSGFEQIKIEPHLCGLNYAEGIIPTECGEIKIRHELKNGKVLTTTELPDGIKIV